MERREGGSAISSSFLQLPIVEGDENQRWSSQDRSDLEVYFLLKEIYTT